MSDDRETQLLELLKRDAEIWHDKMKPKSSMSDDDVLSGSGDVYLIETWEQRKKRRKLEREANLKGESEKLEMIKYVTMHRRVASSKTPGARRASVNRMRAIQSGSRTYMGQPCLRGHSGLRRTIKSDCVECERIRLKLVQSKRGKMVNRG